MPKLIPPEQKAKYLLYRQMGHSQVDSAKIAGLNLTTARNIEYRIGGINPNRHQTDPPVPYKQLSRYPRAALNDIGLFARRYYGLVLLPFHYEDTERVVQWLDSPDKEFVVINIAPGTGKPVSVDALVQMGDGSYKPLRDIQVGDYVITHLGRPRKVLEVFDQGLLDCVQIDDDRGRQVTAANDHPFLTPGGWVNAEDMGGKQGVQVAADIVVGTYRPRHEFRLAGYFVGDGSCSAGNACFTNADDQILSDFTACAKEMNFIVKTRLAYSNCTEVRLVEAEDKGRGYGSLQFWLREAQLYGCNSHTKMVPPWVFTAPNSHIAEFIGAYFDCDGTVGKKGENIEFYSVNCALLRQVQALLLRLGVQSILREKRGSYNGEVHWSWRLIVQERAKFARLIPLVGSKAGRVIHALSAVVSTNARNGECVVTPVGRMECKCLTVEEDHSFTANDFVVSNTTFYTRVLPAWLTCRDRTIRGTLGSASEKLASRYTRILRSDFTRAHPIKHSSEDIEAGIAVDATSTLARDFGKFRPDGQEDTVWRQTSFIVAQMDDAPVAEKEYTWEAFGKDTSIIGTRSHITIWDDLYDPQRLKSPEVKQDLYQWWSTVAEARLEPRGLLLLIGQRIDADDIYHYALEQKRMDDDGAVTPKYHHIIHRAHYDELCSPPATHGPDAPPWPDGCLLYPKRLTWRDLSSIHLNQPDVYEITYQQRDFFAQNVLVQRIWVEGGVDPTTGEEFVGCWDTNRNLCEFPGGLTPPLYSFATADPSPTKYWSIQWWLYHPATQQRFLLDLIRARMDAPDLLDWNHSSGEFVGVMNEWQQRSLSLGVPISHWIIEVNAAQKFLLQYDHVRRWRTFNRVMVIPHTTGVLKTDAELGVPSMKDIWRHGMVRLPGGSYESRKRVQPLVDEVLRYNTAGKQVGTDDCVLAQWFLEFNLPRLAARGVKIARQERPSWAGDWA